MHDGDGPDGLVEAVSFLAVADPPVFGVALLLAAQEGPSGPSVVRDDQAGAEVGAVRDHCRPRGRCGQARLPPDVGVALVTGAGRADAITG
nr:hypothetical protein [Streptomyces erythrochromogenes]